MSGERSAEAHRGFLASLFGKTIVYLRSTSSTNEVAKELAGDGAPEGTVVLAGEQTAGRGRLGRAWYSPRGGSVLLSIIFRPRFAPTELFLLTMLTASAVCRAVEETAGLACSLKWPNDVQIGGRKVCGILAEAAIEGDALAFAVVGVGLNVNVDIGAYADIKDIATSLARELGNRTPRGPLLRSILAGIESRYRIVEAGERHAVFEEWRSRLSTLGKMVAVTDGPRRENGLALDVAGDGTLLVRRDDGTVFHAVAGDVSLRESP
ncbi:MAG: biotin--[acetyl-CoA-carboxylase] ligase [Chloroflexi bacterium]|nr:biotin--[acetyl-CoA-carboxylase] ligase [Chloroflexota bacterium]